MWYLVNRQTGDQTPCLLCNRSYKIGRVQAIATNNPDIPLDGDTSISRTHAEIFIKFTEAQATKIDLTPSPVLTDHSKFGTFVNDTQVNEFHALSPNDLIRFGRNNCYFYLRYTPLTLTTSCVSAVNKLALRKLVCQLGGHILNDWHNDCSFVVMDQLTATVKVIAALICQKYIVTQKYFEDLVKAASNWQQVALEPAKYLPAISQDEESLQNIEFGPNPVRRTIFNGRTFVFFKADELQKMQNVIELAGGRCVVFNKSQHLNTIYLRENQESLVFMQDESDAGDEAKKVLSGLKRRFVDQTEIGLAILYADTEKFCCPWSFKENFENNEFSIGSQTLAHTNLEHEFESINTNTQYNDMVMAAFETQDSAPFEYERIKINETVKISNTPERNENKRNRLPVINVDKKKLKLPVEVCDTQVLGEISEEIVNKKSLLDDFEVNLKSTTVFTDVIKMEKMDLDEKMEVNKKPLLGYVKAKGLVLSKSRPENCEIRTENNENSSSGSQLKVKFESLVKKESVQTSQIVFGEVSEQNRRRNFKKFKKVPKKFQLSARSSGPDGREKRFKSVCKSEPFDVNSQFDSFMNSMR